MGKVTNCDNCGACCLGQNLLPLSGAKLDGVALPPKLEKPLMAILRGPLVGNDECPCAWLDRTKGRCKHHKYRPSFCREFQVGSAECLFRRSQARMDK